MTYTNDFLVEKMRTGTTLFDKRFGFLRITALRYEHNDLVADVVCFPTGQLESVSVKGLSLEARNVVKNDIMQKSLEWLASRYSRGGSWVRYLSCDYPGGSGKTAGVGEAVKELESFNLHTIVFNRGYGWHSKSYEKLVSGSDEWKGISYSKPVVIILDEISSSFLEVQDMVANNPIFRAGVLVISVGTPRQCL